MFRMTISMECFLYFSVNIMKNKLDPEGLGIILLGTFLQEFFPEQVKCLISYFNKIMFAAFLNHIFTFDHSEDDVNALI